MHETPVAAYDGAASWWADAMDRLGYAAAYRDLAQRMLAGSHHHDVADIGTGSGDLARAVCDEIRPERLMLVDSSDAMLAAARDRLAGRISSGNNVGPVANMARRVVTINLEPGCEIPADREFERPNLIADVGRERGRYVAAALTVVHAWIVAGRPESICPSLANYGNWSDWCRQPLLWLGLTDPAASVFVGLAEDPERELLGRLLQGWHPATARATRHVASYGWPCSCRVSIFSRFPRCSADQGNLGHPTHISNKPRLEDFDIRLGYMKAIGRANKVARVLPMLVSVPIFDWRRPLTP